MTNQLNNAIRFLACVLIVCLCALILRGYFFIDHMDVRASALFNEGQTTLAVGNKSLTSLGNFADSQMEQLQSPRAQKSLQASLETLAVFNATGRLLNTQILPRAMKTLDSSDGAMEKVGTLLSNTDKSINGEDGLIVSATLLIGSLTTTAERFGLTVDTLDITLKTISEKTGKSLDEIYSLIASPEWKSAIQNANTVSANLATTAQKIDATAEQIRLAMLKAPSIAESLDKIAKTSSKYQRAVIIAGIISTIAGAFLP
jgi:hypothetical protein